MLFGWLGEGTVGKWCLWGGYGERCSYVHSCGSRFTLFYGSWRTGLEKYLYEALENLKVYSLAAVLLLILLWDLYVICVSFVVLFF